MFTLCVLLAVTAFVVVGSLVEWHAERTAKRIVTEVFGK